MSLFVLINSESQCLCYKPTVGYFFENLVSESKISLESLPDKVIKYKEKNKANCLGRALNLKTKKINTKQE